MRKLLVVAVIAALAGMYVVDARAEEGSQLEISGNTTVVTGWQSQYKSATTLNGGILNDGLNALNGAVKSEDFGFFVDQVEVDLAKSFGENIRVRADLDFTPHRLQGAAVVPFYLEQGYITANIPSGNGIELLIGRFNSGIGLDPIDRNQLSTVSFSDVHRVLLPHNLTGSRFGYDFNEATRLEVYIVNDLKDFAPGTATTTTIPSFGFNLSYAWGDAGNKSWVKYSGAAGPEQVTKKHWSYLADLSGNVAVSDAFWVGAEATFRMDDDPAAATNAKYYAGQLKGRYAFSDVWDGTIRYSIVRDQNGVAFATLPPANVTLGALGLGTKGTLHTVSLATGYQIADGARFVLEGSLDLGKPSAAGSVMGYNPGVAGMFAYSF